MRNGVVRRFALKELELLELIAVVVLNLQGNRRPLFELRPLGRHDNATALIRHRRRGERILRATRVGHNLKAPPEIISGVAVLYLLVGFHECVILILGKIRAVRCGEGKLRVTPVEKRYPGSAFAWMYKCWYLVLILS